MKQKWGIVLALSSLVLLTTFNNCGGSTQPTSTSVASLSSQDSCRLRAGEVSLNPKTVDQVVELINRIEKPVTLPCLISFLPKPLKIYAVNNQASAQPAGGPDSPRIFLFNENLILSVVPDGIAKDYLEMSEVVGIYRSVKAELKFPINDIVVNGEPYLTITDQAGATTCRGCHENATPSTTITSGPAYVSDMILPNPTKRVLDTDLKYWAQYCNSNLTPFRCTMLKNIMLNGQAADAPFTAAPQVKF